MHHILHKTARGGAYSRLTLGRSSNKLVSGYVAEIDFAGFTRKPSKKQNTYYSRLNIYEYLFPSPS